MKKLSQDEIKIIINDVFRSWEGVGEKYHQAKWQMIELIEAQEPSKKQLEELIDKYAEIFFDLETHHMSRYADELKDFRKEYDKLRRE